MRCTSYCTSNSYDIARLFADRQKLARTLHLYRDCLHEQTEERRVRGDIFYFAYGAVVFWGLSEEEEQQILNYLKAYEGEKPGKVELDAFTFAYGETMQIEEDEIILHNKSPLSKLAISYGIAQSVKLTTFEEMIQKTIETTRYLPTELARRGKIPLSRREISKKLGELHIERSFINLHTDVLDTPEFFWEHSELEPFYRKTSHYLDVAKRAEVLNRRLSVIHELLEILGAELNHQHSSRLEWTIILLIAIEIVLVLLRDLFHLI